MSKIIRMLWKDGWGTPVRGFYLMLLSRFWNEMWLAEYDIMLEFGGVNLTRYGMLLKNRADLLIYRI
jgi:hypothetical protein